MHTPETGIEAAVKIATPVAQKIGLGIMMFGAAIAAFGIVIGLSDGDLEFGRRSRTPAPTPLRPTRLTFGAPNLAWATGDGVIYFFARGNPLATYTLWDRLFTPWGNPGNSNVNGNPPPVTTFTIQPPVTTFTVEPQPSSQALGLVITSNSTFTWPARAFAIESDIGLYTLCFPETTTALGSSKTYYYDTNGTPYADQQLRQPLLAQSCTQTLAQAYRPIDLTNASLNGSYGPVHLTFSRTAEAGATLGTLNLRNEWTDGTALIPSRASRAPMAVQIAVPADLPADPAGPTSIALPARTVTVTADSGQITTLCLPDATLRILPTTEELVYFFSADGTPYLDALLIRRATSANCSTLLAKAFVPRSITAARFHQAFNRGTLPTDFAMTFILNREVTTLIQVDGSNNATTPGQTIPATNTGRSPLAVMADFAADGLVLPARTITLAADGGQIALCWPETQAGPANPGAPRSLPALYFYANDGTPYRDSLLTVPAMTGRCLANALIPTEINSAIASARIDATHGIYVYNRGNLAGTIDGSTWTANQGSDPATVHPLTLVLGGGNGSDVVNVPTLQVTMTYDGNKSATLCFPGKTGVHLFPVELAYYYDQYGRPYSDALLQKPVVCSGGGGGKQQVSE